MAHIQKRETSMRRNGRPVVRYVVHWQEVVRQSNGVPVSVVGADASTRTKRRHRERSFPTDSDARAFLLTVSHDQATGTARDYRAGEEPFGTFAAGWLDKVSAEVKPKTFESYETAVRKWLLPTLAHRPVASLSLVDGDRIVGDLRRAGLSKSSMRTIVAVLRRVLDHAVRVGALTSNPLGLLELPRARKLGRDFRPVVLAPTDVERVAENLVAPYDLLVLFAAYTGLRQGEQAALNVSDVAVERAPGGYVGTVSVTKTAEKVSGGWRIAEPKSERSIRTVPMPGWLAEEMAAYLDAHPRRDEPDAPLWPSRAKGGHHDRSGRYATGHGQLTYAERWEPTAFSRTIFKPALLAAGLPVSGAADGTAGVRWHDLRHFFASVALAADVPVMQVSTWLGHASHVVTMTVYAHLLPDAGAAARHANKLVRPARSASPAVADLSARRSG